MSSVICSVRGRHNNWKKRHILLEQQCYEHNNKQSECYGVPYNSPPPPSKEEDLRLWPKSLRLKPPHVCSYHFVEEKPTPEHPFPEKWLGYEAPVKRTRRVLVRLSGAFGTEWSVKYNQQEICALKGSTVFMNGTYTHPEHLTVKETFWTVDLDKKPDLSKDPDYSGRVDNLTDEQKHFSLKLSDVMKKDEHQYYFRIKTNVEYEKWVGLPGVQLRVTEIHVETPEEDDVLYSTVTHSPVEAAASADSGAADVLNATVGIQNDDVTSTDQQEEPQYASLTFLHRTAATGVITEC
ncbi:uncharacterized protein LOC118797732 [Colossoma macropomum]|uniref:uncharacterized protein LOC118797732 n=1 Tax=Colossoma macropomum TaxID=42526 RepID=UPI0018642F50|nr:uncharacterized protein LOC118797732 [Colossoma macropomum]